jgi:hypothetical protein
LPPFLPSASCLFNEFQPPTTLGPFSDPQRPSTSDSSRLCIPQPPSSSNPVKAPITKRQASPRAAKGKQSGANSKAR